MARTRSVRSNRNVSRWLIVPARSDLTAFLTVVKRRGVESQEARMLELGSRPLSPAPLARREEFPPSAYLHLALATPQIGGRKHITMGTLFGGRE